MERQTKHRILGLLVIVGLVVIMLPFFQTSDLPPETAIVKAPPFPDQSTQVTTTDTTEPVATPEPEEHHVSAIREVPESEAQPAQPQPTAATTPTPPSIKQPEATTTSSPAPSKQSQTTSNTSDLSGATPDVATMPNEDDLGDNIQATVKEIDNVIGKDAATPQEIAGKPKAETKTEPVVPTPKVVNTNKEIKVVDGHLQPKKTKTQKTAIKTHITKQKTTPQMHLTSVAPTDKNGLVKLKNAAWVVQMGSFKNKENALRLVNDLRKKGYRSFIQQVSSGSSARTRVYVGPHVKQAEARSIIDKLEQETHIKGIVVSYKPLAL